jgi:uncharacterized protein (TIRG00374 family)
MSKIPLPQRKFSRRIFAGKCIIALLLLGFLLYSDRLIFASTADFFKSSQALSAFLWLAGAVVLGYLRWQILIQRFGLGLWAGLKLFLFGLFAGNFLPGGISGDLVRGYYLKTHYKKELSQTLAIVTLDRALGLIALLSITLLVALGYFHIQGHLLISMLLLLFILIVTPLATYFLLRSSNINEMNASRTFLSRTIIKLAKLVFNLSRLIKDKPAITFLCGTIALLQQVVVTLAMASILDFYAPKVFSWAEVIFCNTFATLINILPLTPGGIGLGESAFYFSAKMLRPELGSLPLATAFLCFRLIFIAITSVGVIPWIFQKRAVQAA